MPITKRPCANCPFRNDGAAIELQPGRLNDIVGNLQADDHATFVCHKTTEAKMKRMTCAGAVAFMSKLGRMPVIARLGLVAGVISAEDVAASAALVIEPEELFEPSQSR